VGPTVGLITIMCTITDHLTMDIAKESRSNNINIIKYGSLSVLVVQNVSLVVLVRYSRTRGNTSSPYLGSAAVLMTELLKFIINLVLECLWYKKVRSFPDFLNWLQGILISNQTLRLGLPALLYVIQNNLLYVALANLSVPVYVVLNQGKLIATAMCSWFLLRKYLSMVQWFSITMLAMGVAVVQLSQIDDAGKNKHQLQNRPIVGVAAMGISCITSSFAGVYFEKMLKTKSNEKTSLHVINLQLSSWSILLSGIAAYATDSAMIREHGLLQGFDAITWVVVTNQALGGLLVAVVMKHADNILKGFATSISIIFSCLISVCIWGIAIDWSFGLGTTLVIGAVFLYEGVCPSCETVSMKRCVFPRLSIGRLLLSATGLCVVSRMCFSTNHTQYLQYISASHQLDEALDITVELTTVHIPQYHSCGVLSLSPALSKREFGLRMIIHDAIFWSNGHDFDLQYKDGSGGTKPSFEIMSKSTVLKTLFSANSTVNNTLLTDDVICSLLLEHILSLPDHSSDKIMEAFKILLSGLDLRHYLFNRKRSTCSPRMVAVVDAALTCAEIDLYGYAECDNSFPISSSESSEMQAAEKAMIDALLNLPSTKCAPMFLKNKCVHRTQLPIPKQAKDCAIVGSAGKLKGSNLGSVINSHDFVVRMNLAPVRGYEMDVGNRTDIRVINWPSWMSVNKNRQREKRQFLVDIDPTPYRSVRLISVFGPKPAIRYSESSEKTCIDNVFTEEQIKRHKVERNASRFRATSGFEMLMRCMYICTRVHVYGMSNPAEGKDVPYHYYDHEEQRKYLTEVTWDAWILHNFAMEKGKVAEWVNSHIIDQD